MLHLTLLPSLLLPSVAAAFPEAPAATDLTLALPSESVTVVKFSALGGDDGGAWGRMLADPRWSELLQSLIESAAGDLDADHTAALFRSFLPLASEQQLRDRIRSRQRPHVRRPDPHGERSCHTDTTRRTPRVRRGGRRVWSSSERMRRWTPTWTSP